MSQALWGTVRQGRIELIEPTELPEGARVLVLLLPDDGTEAAFQLLNASFETVSWTDVGAPQNPDVSAYEEYERQMQVAAAEFTRPWSERRGIESVDRNAEVFLVRAPLDDLFDALSEQAIESRKDVLGTEIEVLGDFVLSYQIVGQTWSLIVKGYVLEGNYQAILQSHELAQLSRRLQQPIIHLQVSDTVGTISYDLYETGDLAEYFRGGEPSLDVPEDPGIQPQRFSIVWYPGVEIEGINSEDLASRQTAYFWSRKRQLTDEKIGNIWNFVYRLLEDYEAYDPALSCEYFFNKYDAFRLGDRHPVQNPGITMGFGFDREGQAQEAKDIPD